METLGLLRSEKTSKKGSFAIFIGHIQGVSFIIYQAICLVMVLFLLFHLGSSTMNDYGRMIQSKLTDIDFRGFIEFTVSSIVLTIRTAQCFLNDVGIRLRIDVKRVGPTWRRHCDEGFLMSRCIKFFQLWHIVLHVNFFYTDQSVAMFYLNLYSLIHLS